MIFRWHFSSGKCLANKLIELKLDSQTERPNLNQVTFIKYIFVSEQ